VTEAANAATLTAGTVAVDVPHIAGNYVTGAWHFYDFLSGDHDRLTVNWPLRACSVRGAGALLAYAPSDVMGNRHLCAPRRARGGGHFSSRCVIGSCLE